MKLTVMVGPPASGKSTYVRQNFPRHMVVSHDVMAGRSNLPKEAVIAETHRRLVLGIDTVVDMTCLEPLTRTRLLALARYTGAKTHAVVMLTPFQDILNRDGKRQSPHDPQVLGRCHDKLRKAQTDVWLEGWDDVTYC